MDIETADHDQALAAMQFDAAFVDFYRREHAGQVRRAYLLLGASGAAHDVVADAFVAVLQRWETITEPGPYLSRCVVNGCHDSHRRRSREHPAAEPMVDEAVYDRIDDPGDEMAAALLALPFRQRAAIVLRYFGGLGVADIARQLDCRPGTVGSLIHRGLASLRKTITIEEDHRDERP